jgi:hypothetical protein
MVEESPISILDVLMQEGLQLVNVDTKQCRGQGETLFEPNGPLDKIRNPLHCA